MKMAKRSVAVNGHPIRVWLVVGAVVLWVPAASRAINAVSQEVAAGQTVPAARSSPGVADIVRMVDAKVDAEVIKTYIKNSPTAYNPNATEIIALRDRGVGPEILTAMLQRGAEVRVQSMQAAQAVASTVAPQTYPAAANPYAPAPAYPNYAYSYPVDSYAYPSYAYAYPGYNYGYCSYGYGWPYCWPSLSFSFGGYPYRGFCGYRYPGWYGGRGGFGHGARFASFAGHGGGFHSFGGGGHAASFAGSAGGFRAVGGFSGHAASFGGHGGGFGGHGSGRGR
jgi:hypothetical protein